MKCLLQRVSSAAVHVAQECVGAIDTGLLVFVGIEPHDSTETLNRMADRVLAYRVFPDDQGRMNLNVAAANGGVLLVSQFTLAADTRSGNRPGFQTAATPERARVLFDEFVTRVSARHPDVATGRFGADMKVSLVNDGPVTFLLEV
jgi:D-tyrosyl-tRNA(Tyr) deacylase